MLTCDCLKAVTLQESNPGDVYFSVSQCTVSYFQADTPLLREVGGGTYRIPVTFNAHSPSVVWKEGTDFFRVFVNFHAKKV